MIKIQVWGGVSYSLHPLSPGVVWHPFNTNSLPVSCQKDGMGKIKPRRAIHRPHTHKRIVLQEEEENCEILRDTREWTHTGMETHGDEDTQRWRNTGIETQGWRRRGSNCIQKF